LFILGNGFDLNLNLKTSYQDVIKAYRKKKLTTKNLQQFQKDLWDDIRNWSNFESRFGKHSEDFNIDNREDYFERRSSFEKILKEHFKNQEKRIDYKRNKDKIQKSFKTSLVDYNQFLEKESRITITNLITYFSADAKFVYNFITFNYTSILEKCFEQVISDNKYLRFGSDDSINGASSKYEKGDIIHVHGTLDNSLILGVDNTSQIANKELADNPDFQKRIIKSQLNKGTGELHEEDAKKLIRESKIICLFGVSIGETDQLWWKVIYDWLKSNESRHLIIFYYKEKYDRSDTDKTNRDKDAIRNILYSLAGTKDEHKHQVENRIHIAYSKEMFKIDFFTSDINP
jgi:hypothetical protein